jgi:transposase
VLRRHELSQDEWKRVRDLLPGRESDAGVTAKDNRKFLNAVLWIAKTGAQWRDLPERFGKWNSVYKRFRRWCVKGTWENIFSSLSVDVDPESLLIDSTIVRAQVDAAGVKGGTRKLKPLAVAEAVSQLKSMPLAML